MRDDLERLVTAIPGPRSLELGVELRRTEARGVTYLANDFPVFWDSAAGALVYDVDGNRYIDGTAAFGVAVTGHANPAVAEAIAKQARRLPHGMGDVHPSETKTRLLAKLAAVAPFPAAKSFLCSSGAEAVEFALKTALLVNGRPNVVAFEGAYHGLSYGTLEVGGIEKFRTPWRSQLRGTTTFVKYPDALEPQSLQHSLAGVAAAFARDPNAGALIVEPIQGRAGVIVPPDGFLRGLRTLCDEARVVLIFDEIYTGFGRTGTYFACERECVAPDLLCVGKALAGGFPISATLGSAAVADAWAPSEGEALHTSTYLGNPMGCAAALANLGEIERLGIAALARNREATIGARLRKLGGVSPHVVAVRGRGMLWALEFDDGARANACVLAALVRGLILLQSGLQGESITFAPPPVITEPQLERAFDLFSAALAQPVLA